MGLFNEGTRNRPLNEQLMKMLKGVANKELGRSKVFVGNQEIKRKEILRTNGKGAEKLRKQNLINQRRFQERRRAAKRLEQQRLKDLENENANGS